MTQNAVSTTAKTQAPTPKEPIKKGGELAALVPENIEQAYRLAVALSGAGDMVPRHFQGKPDATMAAIVRGMEIGLAPMQALSNIAVINGRASLWGDAMPALMQRAGHHVDVAIENEHDLEKAVAVASLTRGDTGKTIERRFSYQDAKRAGLAGKQGPWQQYPLRMLANRARAFAVRDGAADALMGLGIADEVQDYGPDSARDITPAAPKRGGVIYAAVDDDLDEIHEGSATKTGEAMDAEIIAAGDDTFQTLSDEEADRITAEIQEANRAAAEAAE